MYKRKNFISMGMSLILAAGITVSPAAAADFTDGTVCEFDSDDAAEFGVMSETADSAEITSDTETGISDESDSDEKDSDEANVITESILPDADNIPDNSQLLEEYLNGILYGQDQSVQPGKSVAEDALSGVQQAVYEELKSKVSAVAARGGSTKFSISADLGLTWQTTASGKALDKEVSSHFNTLNTSKIINCLLADCPYELYWYEKTAYTMWQYSYTTTTVGNRTTVRIKNISVSISYFV